MTTHIRQITSTCIMGILAVSVAAAFLSWKPIYGNAIGIGITPGEITIEKGRHIYALVVSNPFGEPGIFRFVDLKDSGATAQIEQFPLGPGEHAITTLTFERLPAGKRSFGIVVSGPAADAMAVRPGIRVPVHGLEYLPLLATVQTQTHGLVLIGMGIFLTGLSIGLNLSRARNG